MKFVNFTTTTSGSQYIEYNGRQLLNLNGTALPTWLKEGDTLTIVGTFPGNTGYEITYTIDALEFNVIP